MDQPRTKVGGQTVREEFVGRRIRLSDRLPTLHAYAVHLVRVAFIWGSACKSPWPDVACDAHSFFSRSCMRRMFRVSWTENNTGNCMRKIMNIVKR